MFGTERTNETTVSSLLPIVLLLYAEGRWTEKNLDWKSISPKKCSENKTSDLIGRFGVGRARILFLFYKEGKQEEEARDDRCSEHPLQKSGKQVAASPQSLVYRNQLLEPPIGGGQQLETPPQSWAIHLRAMSRNDGKQNFCGGHSPALVLPLPHVGCNETEK